MQNLNYFTGIIVRSFNEQKSEMIFYRVRAQPGCFKFHINDLFWCLFFLQKSFLLLVGSSLCYAIADGNTQLIMHLLAFATKEHVTTQIGITSTFY